MCSIGNAGCFKYMNSLVQFFLSSPVLCPYARSMWDFPTYRHQTHSQSVKVILLESQKENIGEKRFVARSKTMKEIVL